MPVDENDRLLIYLNLLGAEEIPAQIRSKILFELCKMVDLKPDLQTFLEIKSIGNRLHLHERPIYACHYCGRTIEKAYQAEEKELIKRAVSEHLQYCQVFEREAIMSAGFRRRSLVVEN